MSDGVVIAAIVGLWLAFGVSHTVLASASMRPRLVAALGQGGYLGLYSLVAIAVFVPLVWVYMANKHAGPLLWSVGFTAVTIWPYYVAMGAAFTLMVLGIATPSPASMGSTTELQAHGVFRITRHPLFMGVGLFGLLHLIPNGFASDVAFFGGLPMFAVVGCWHQDQRKLAEGVPGFARFIEQTPFLPFTGAGTVQGLKEIGITLLIAGAALTTLIRYFHAQLFG